MNTLLICVDKRESYLLQRHAQTVLPNATSDFCVKRNTSCHLLKNDYRTIKQHIAKSHQDSQSHAQDSTVGVSVHDDSQSPAEETTVSDNVHDDTIFDDNDSCRELDKNEIEGIADQLNIEDNEYDVDFETETMYHPPPSGDITIELEDFEVFSNDKSNVYF